MCRKWYWTDREVYGESIRTPNGSSSALFLSSIASPEQIVTSFLLCTSRWANLSKEKCMPWIFFLASAKLCEIEVFETPRMRHLNPHNEPGVHPLGLKGKHCLVLLLLPRERMAHVWLIIKSRKREMQWSVWGVVGGGVHPIITILESACSSEVSGARTKSVHYQEFQNVVFLLRIWSQHGRAQTSPISLRLGAPIQPLQL